MVVGDTVRERVVARFKAPSPALLERPELAPLFLRQLQFVHIVFHVRLEIGGHVFAQPGSGIAHVLPKTAGVG